MQNKRIKFSLSADIDLNENFITFDYNISSTALISPTAKILKLKKDFFF